MCKKLIKDIVYTKCDVNKKMGIKHLNRYLINKCSKNSIKRISLQYLSGKTIVIDAFIYIYKYLGDDKLIENTNQLVMLFKQYKITPIFVFDGKPPEEKKSLLLQRREKKKEAEMKYKEIINQIETGLDRSKELDTQLACLKKQFLKVDFEHIQCVKSILREYGVNFIDAPGESDQICVQYVKSNKAWACMSDDMDMFVYGTPRVLRELSLTTHSIEFYNLSSILGDLRMDIRTFRQIMVLSGTDYNTNDKVSLHETLKWYNDYRKSCSKPVANQDFYSWLLRNTKYIQDYSKLMKVYEMFDLPEA